VVWSEKGAKDWDIAGFDVSSQKSLSIVSAGGDQVHPAIDGGMVVWEDHRPVDKMDVPRIYVMDLQSKHESPVTAESSPQWQPDISGDTVVFRDWRASGTCSWGEDIWGGSTGSCDWDIWGTNLKTHEESPVSTAIGSEYAPVASGDWVTWERSQGLSSEVPIYQLKSNTQTLALPGASSPAVDGSIVVFENDIPNQRGIFGYYLPGGKEFPIASGDDKDSPRLSGNVVIWVDRRNGNADIYGYNLASGQEFPVCTAPGDQEDPTIDGDTVVWIDKRNGELTEIYGARLPFANEGQTQAVVPAPTSSPGPTPEGQVRALVGQTSGISDVAWSPDGKTIATGSSDQTVALWDAATGRRQRTLVQWGPGKAAWSPDGKTLASAGGTRITLTEEPGGRFIRYLSAYSDIGDLAWSPDGKTIAVATNGGVVLFDPGQWDPFRTIEGEKRFEAVAWSPDGKTIASAEYDGPIGLWDPATGERLRTIESGATHGLAWSPDGQSLAAGSNDQVRVWNAQTGGVIRDLQPGNGSVSSVSWSPDGRTLAAGTSAAAVVLLDASTGQRLVTLSGHTDEVSSLGWSPDGKTLASGSSDGITIVWDVAGRLAPAGH
jgi:beta propeller repeat protein